MKKNIMKSKIFLKSAAIFSAVLFFVSGLPAASSSMSESLKDDVTAMITNAKKLPHTIFIIDSSESMNSFAFSDYIDNCADGLSNIDKAIVLCNNAYKQCRNVEADAMCDVNLGCGDVISKCSQMTTIRSDIASFCQDVSKTYQEPGRHETAATDSVKALKYVGPWDPSRTYTDDICFYDWSKDSDGNVLNGTTTAEDLNKALLGEGNYPANATNRRDWDCLTDGKGRMYNNDGTLGEQFTSVSGLWLNWKFSTSLDAIKIILADTHKFSFPPRYRGHNDCHKTVFKPWNEYFENDSDGNPVTKRTCFLGFDTAFNGFTSENRKEQLTAMKDAIASQWEEVLTIPNATEKSDNTNADQYAYKDSFCQSFSDPKDIVMFKNEDHESLSAQPEPVSPAVGACDRCMRWNQLSKSFEEAPCESYVGAMQSGKTDNLGSAINKELSKMCCKTYDCTNPKCRDNDIYCKNDSNECVLGYYSEYDQDANHCCNDVTCAEQGSILTYTDPITHQECQKCDSGTTMGVDSFETSTGPVTILGTPSSGNSYGPASDTDTGIAFSVFFDSFGITPSESDSQIQSVKVTVYFGCLDDGSEHPTGLFGSKTFSAAEVAACASSPTDEGCKISGLLSGCDDKGYVVEAVVNVNRSECRYESLEISAQLKYELGAYRYGSYSTNKILDKNTPFYQIFRYEASDKLTKVYEYECRAAFYHRQALVVDGGSCPSSTSAPALINAANGNNTVEYCDGGTLEREVIARDQWGAATKIACSWQCRDAIIYDDPWKCGAFFYMMDDRALHNGANQACIDECRLSMGGTAAQTAAEEVYYTQNNEKVEPCCKCLDKVSHLYQYLERPQGVVLSDNKKYTCAVSGYQFGTASNGRQTTTSGYMAEIIRGSINEAPGGGSYALQPYNNFEGSIYTDTPYNRWYQPNSLIVKGEGFVKDTFISAFETANDARRESVCVYDILKYGWEGEDCNSCGTGCCAVDLSQEGNECDYPQFWMKIPRSDGGRHIYGAGDFSNTESIEAFRSAVREIKAIGGSTLGETLYDVWRYLGGMYALHDPNHTYKVGGTNSPYTSPFENQDATCFTNEAVIISGGQPEFDHNDALANISGLNLSCPAMNSNSTSTNTPCVSHVGGDSPTKAHPYYQSDWHQTSLLNVVNFTHENTFWGKDSCRKSTDLSKNALGFTGDCVETANNTGENKARINHVHTISIGEWGLAPLRSVTNAGTGDFLDSSYLKKAAERTGGNYYGLTSDVPKADAGGGGTFQTLTELFSDMMQHKQATDVVSGRPHWTSSLVQPFDVEEKYRGPDAYSAGAVPIDGSVSRFWFGNLKKYMVDDNSGSCSITDDTNSNCGEWKKQTFPNQDCFGPDDSGTDFSGDADAIDQFKKLMTGGAAYKLEQKIKSSTCGTLPCFKSSPRKIYYDDGTENDIKQLTSEIVADSKVYEKFRAEDPSVTPDKINRIFDYMAGYDAFKPTEAERKAVRFTAEGEQTFKVQDPINVDFNQGNSSELTLRPLLLGAIIHSKPLAVHYNGTSSTRIYAGANDGMLHAFDENGNEVYAYIPSNAFKSILNFGEQQSGIFFNATVDGPIAILHIDQSHDGIINTKDAVNNVAGEKAFLIFGYRRGGKGYTVIDISDPNKPKFVQNINTGGGYSFGKVAVFRKCSGTCSYAEDLDYYIAVPGGYDTCHDPATLTTVKSDNIPICGSDIDEILSTLKGNHFSIFKFDKENGKFLTDSSQYLKFGFNSPDSMMSAKTKSWFVTSFPSVPLVVNTKGKAAVDTEFIYFTDLSGTVFRADVRNSDMSKWTAKVVYAQRADDGSSTAKLINWQGGIARSYVASNFFPPLERYNPQKNDDDNSMLIPIPMVTGNAANPKIAEGDGLVVFYDKKTGDYDSVNSSDYSVNNSGTRDVADTILGGLFNSRGWTVSFGQEVGVTTGEKGITEPLITYNIYGTKSNDEKANAYSIAWNTYIPKKATECKNFGTSSNYERIINNGKQAFTELTMTGSNGEWTSSRAGSECKLDNPNLSLATSVGIIATDKGYDLTFGAGADIFRKREMTVKLNKTYIIKWYELY